MINIRNIITFILIVTTIMLVSCAIQEDTSDNTNGGYFGYNTKYKGYTNHAVFRAYKENEKIAKELVNAINKANLIYNMTIVPLIPQLFLDNGTQFIHENGTCTGMEGFREYNTIKTPSNSDNITKFSDIIYNKYCLKKAVSTVPGSVIIDNVTRLKETANFDGNLFNSYYYELLFENGVSVKIQNNHTSWDNMTLHGIIYKNEKCYNTNNTNCPNQDILIRVDMPGNETNFRFDLEAKYTSNNNKTTFKKEIKFFHHEYGYVTADITFLKDNILVSPGDKITMKFKDKNCVFSTDEFNTNEFYCGEYEHKK